MDHSHEEEADALRAQLGLFTLREEQWSEEERNRYEKIKKTTVKQAVKYSSGTIENL